MIVERPSYSDLAQFVELLLLFFVVSTYDPDIVSGVEHRESMFTSFCR
jgi:hypothetical protein